MNNFIIAIKKFIKNKNTVTILGVFACVAILYVGYNARIKAAIEPKSMPYALETIQPRTKITDTMVGIIDVPPVRLKGNVINNRSQVIGKYSNVNTIIPAGSLFYAETIVNYEELPDAALINIPEGLIPYNFRVDIESTYGNSIFPGNRIDIYFKGLSDSGEILVGKLVENVKVLAVKDRQGRHVFENTEEQRTPAILIFAVPEDIHLLLRSAEYMKKREVVLLPVPYGGVYETEDGEIMLTNSTIVDFIRTYAPDISDIEIPDFDENIIIDEDEDEE